MKTTYEVETQREVIRRIDQLKEQTVYSLTYKGEKVLCVVTCAGDKAWIISRNSGEACGTFITGCVTNPHEVKELVVIL